MGRSVFIAVMLLVALGCGSSNPDETVYREGESPVSMVQSDDPEMARAIAKARETVDDFIAELGKPPRGREFAVKVPLPTPDGNTEHIWADTVSYQDGKFSAKLANEPLNLPGRKLGDPVEVRREDISDWMIMDGEQMIGAYTAKLLMEREAAKQ